MAMRCTLPTPGPALEMTSGMAALVPALQGERVHLRSMALSDFDLFCEVVCGPRGRFLSQSDTPTEAWYEFGTLAAGWALHGHGCWTIESTSGAVIGFVLIGLEPGDLEPELGYFIAAPFEGRGLAFEAATLALEYARTHLRLPSLVSYIDPGNHRSIALAQRLGAHRDGNVEDCDVFRYPMGGRA